ncbi:hypothetical protein [Symbiopectobacterium sp. RP]|uniref:hypothetical protein n=1 Tax=Symbiopectobacterium sp. RP TaxID=3248553 RepID=UPI003D2A08D5
MITASYAFLPHIRVSVVIIFKSVGYTVAKNTEKRGDGCNRKRLSCAGGGACYY